MRAGPGRLRPGRVELGVEPLSLLPFLDIVTAVTGIFIVVFAAQAVRAIPEPRRATPQQIIGCTTGGDLLHFATPGAAARAFAPRDLPALMAEARDTAGGAATILFAYAAPCFEARAAVVRAFAQRPDEGGGPPLRLVEWPLASDPGSLEALIGTWERGGVVPP